MAKCKIHIDLTATPVGLYEPVKEVLGMMHQSGENTAFCLSCSNEWPATWDIEGELTAVCPECQWRLGVPEEFISSEWWTTQELMI